ncbi:unnamed protein product [marine sediment metagenome]|uniref:Uncharacterized protein n=1 Tax=marine sediment metagenome TaxID=412755 RepID=X1RPQ6_9ZZZZ
MPIIRVPKNSSNPKPLHEKQQVAIHQHTNTKKKNKTYLKTTKLFKNLATSSKVVQDDPSLKDIKLETKLLLYEFGIKKAKRLFEIFQVSDIFDYVDWMLPFKNKIRNKTGFLVTALTERRDEPELFRKARLP